MTASAMQSPPAAPFYSRRAPVRERTWRWSTRPPVPSPAPMNRQAIELVLADIGECPRGLKTFFELVFSDDPRRDRTKRIAASFRLHPATLTSRMWRNRLPSPKRYALYAQLVQAAYMLENPKVSIARVAIELGFASPQGFYRTLLEGIGMHGAAFRAQYDGARMLQRFRDDLVRPHVDVLRDFNPLAPVTRVGSRSRHQSHPECNT